MSEAECASVDSAQQEVQCHYIVIEVIPTKVGIQKAAKYTSQVLAIPTFIRMTPPRLLH